MKTLGAPLREKAGSMRKPHCYSTGSMTIACGALILCLKVASTIAAPSRDIVADENGGRRTVTLILHATDKNGNPVPPSSLQALEVAEHGEVLQIVNGPTSAGPKQIAFIVDSNFHQKQVLELEKETTESLLSRFEKGNTRALVMNYGTGIHTSGALTDNSDSLRTFTRSIQADTDKRNPTILLFDALKQAMDTLDNVSGNKGIVLFAEGNGYGNSVQRKTLASLAQQNHIACYVVLFADHTFYGPKAIRHYGWDLVDLARKTGGKFWEAGSNARKAETIAGEVVREANSQAIIEVVPSTSSDHAFHRIKMTALGRRLQAQTGYFDDSY